MCIDERLTVSEIAVLAPVVHESIGSVVLPLFQVRAKKKSLLLLLLATFPKASPTFQIYLVS